MKCKSVNFKKTFPLNEPKGHIYFIDNSTKRKIYPNGKRALPHSTNQSQTEFFIDPSLQYFLATICDLVVKPEKRTRLGLRYSKTPQVENMLKRLTHQQCIYSSGLLNVDTNSIITTLKELLSNYCGGIFDDSVEEFIAISPHCPTQIVLIYVNGLINRLPYYVRQLAYLICLSLKNLIAQSAGNLLDRYTDALLLFTPVLFPNSVADLERFLRATRITLVLIDLCNSVFRPFLWFSTHLSDDYFFRGVMKNLSYLYEWLEGTDNTADNTDKQNEIEYYLSPFAALPNSSNYYQIAYD